MSTQLVAIPAAPSPVRPRTHHQHIRDAGILPFGRTIRLQRAEQILGVVPSADGHHRAAHIFEMRPNVTRLPEGIISRVRQEFLPLGRPAFQSSLSELASGPMRRKKS